MPAWHIRRLANGLLELLRKTTDVAVGRGPADAIPVQPVMPYTVTLSPGCSTFTLSASGPISATNASAVWSMIGNVP